MLEYPNRDSRFYKAWKVARVALMRRQPAASKKGVPRWQTDYYSKREMLERAEAARRQRDGERQAATEKEFQKQAAKKRQAEEEIRVRLARIDEAGRLLIEANSMPQVKEIRDRAESDWLYSRRKDDSFSNQQRAAELKLKAERKLGKLLAVKYGGGKRSRKMTALPNGISRLQSERWQREAQVDENQFEDFVIASKEKGVELSTGALLRFQREAERERERKREQEQAAQDKPSTNGHPPANIAPPLPAPAILTMPPVPQGPILCNNCRRRYGIPHCQECVLRNDPRVELRNGVLFLVRP